MNPDKLLFLFGETFEPDAFDLTDDDERGFACETYSDPDLEPMIQVTRRLVTNQVLDDEPEETWKTIERLQVAGLDREGIWSQLSLVVMHAITEGMAHDRQLADEFIPALDALPLIDLHDLTDMVLDLVAEQPGITHEALLDQILADDPLSGLNRRRSDALVNELEQYSAPIHYAYGGRLFLLSELTTDAVLTRVVTQAEIDARAVAIDADLAPLTLIVEQWAEDSNPFTLLPDGTSALPLPSESWHNIAAGDTIAVSVAGAEHFQAEKLSHTPEVDAELVERLRIVAVRLIDESGLPEPISTLGLDLLSDNPNDLRTPAAPLSVLIEAAGLECRDSMVSHDPATWLSLSRFQRDDRIARMAGGDDELADHLLELLNDADTVSEPAGDVHAEDLEGAVHHLLDCLSDPSLMDSFTSEFFGYEPPDNHELLVDTLNPAATSRSERAIAAYLAACAAEVAGDLSAAEQYLEIAREADSKTTPATRRLAWYTSDRGDAQRALSLYRQVASDGYVTQTADTIRAVTPDGPSDLGRNDPCFCGSGRKYKQCHLGSSQIAPLEVRSTWLCRKAAEFIEMDLGSARDEFMAIVAVLVGGAVDPAGVNRVLDDPLTMDILLTEGGWFEVFSERRGALLPDDEALMAASWILIERSVYEIIDVQRDKGLTVRDLRNGDHIEVTERTFTHSVRRGEMYCLRVVPVGEQHQMVGGGFPVRVGLEQTVLDVLDTGDAMTLAAYVAGRNGPPKLVDREGSPIDLDDPDFDLSAIARPSPLDLTGLGDNPSIEQVQLAVLEQMETTWCDEKVPALGGVTPREAAADPTRRDQLERLLAEFDRRDSSPGGLTFRPDRLREILGLS